jgi:hypothetical protein
MPRLRFDPFTYQFYYRCRPDEVARAKTAGFAWDRIRGRYYTEDPHVAVGLAGDADNYVWDLLADVLGEEPAWARQACAGTPASSAQASASTSSWSNAIH